jgi:hypothetical protein
MIGLRRALIAFGPGRDRRDAPAQPRKPAPPRAGCETEIGSSLASAGLVRL